MISVFLPCRAGSVRVPRKNIKPFAGVEHGLIELKLKQLSYSKLVDEVVLSTNDVDILEYAEQLGLSKLRVHRRAEHLCSSETSTDDLVSHALDLIPQGHILWTHVTSPFIGAKVYDEIIEQYYLGLERGYDSLMTTTLIHGFLWDDNAPINYDRTVEKWPRTQTIAPIHEVNSGVFLNSAQNYAQFNDRIGTKPYLYPLNKIIAHDVDWQEDFIIAEAIYKNRLVP